jgi:outer membrane protein OmpA-like peptidoglycan-associated protein
MSFRAITLGVAALVLAAPASAQERGTVEFGAFGSGTNYDKSLGMDNSMGAGLRFGAFLHPRLSFEFEGGGGKSNRTLGLATVNQTSIAGRFTAVPLQAGRLSFLLGAGGVHNDFQFDESFGFQGLVGLKFAIANAAALRVDGMQDWNSNSPNSRHLQAGISFYRNPFGRTSYVTLTRTVPGPSIPQRADSVSAYETGRLRATSASYDTLRDSLNKSSNKYSAPSSAAALTTMQQMIYFHNDRSDLSDSAKKTLSDKVTVFRANPAMRIVISGFASQPGTEAYNMALGLKRAEAAKAYLVSQGVDPIRIEIVTGGEGQLAVEGPGEIADAANRRGQFRLLIADPYLVKPKN